MLEFDFEDCNFIRLTDDYVIKEFDCGDSDLNEFLFQNAKPHQNQLLAVTYILESPTGEIILYVSLLNDKIGLEDFSKTQYLERIQKLFSWGTSKRNYKSHPAFKIGRFAVDFKFQSLGYGKVMLDYLKEWFITNNRTGCRFITIDAYNNNRSIAFYENNEFVFFNANDEGLDTRQMYFDLLPWKEKSLEKLTS